MYTTCSRRAAMAALLSAAALHDAAAQDGPWPARPIKLVVAFAPGGTVDQVSRLLAARLAPLLGQAVVVENRPGAGGNLATEQVLRAPPDGYTFVVGGSPTQAVNQHLFRLSYDPIGDMTQVALLASAPNLLVVGAGLPVQTVQDLVKLARSKPGELSFSSSGIGTSGHLAGELFAKQAGIKLAHVPYKGQADAITAVIRGDLALAFVTLAGTLQMVEAGRLRAIGITSRDRSPLAPDIPTVVQSGYPEFEVNAWYSVAAPRGVPASVVARLAQAIERVMNEPETADKLKGMGATPSFLAGEPLVDFMKKDSARWGRVVRDAGIQAN
jgi:tripartite-type tricarboxylate transporter receptor subunit TctC